MTKNTFAARLRSLRRERQLSQSQVAALAGLRPQQMWWYESGRGVPQLDTLGMFAKAFNMTLSELLEGVG